MAGAAETIPPSTENNNGHSPDSKPDNSPRDLLLVSVPRTASNLLLRVLNIQHQPNVLTNDKGGYFYHMPFLIAATDLKKPADQWTDAEKTRVLDAYQESFNQFEEYRTRARREGKMMFAKEHAFWIVDPGRMHDQSESSDSDDKGAAAPASFFRLNFPDTYGPSAQQTFSRNNYTVFPDEYLRTWQLAFVIRHPALGWPSMYRAMTKMVDLKLLDEDGLNGASLASMSMAWSRKMFDWALEQSGGKVMPLVIDAHDVIHNPGAVLRFCEKVGLDKDVVRFEWDVAPMSEGWGKNDLDRAARVMYSTLEASKGIVKDKAPVTVDIKVEAEKWKAEFGEEVAGLIEKSVWDAMPDYEYLRERRVQA